MNTKTTNRITCLRAGGVNLDTPKSDISSDMLLCLSQLGQSDILPRDGVLVYLTYYLASPVNLERSDDRPASVRQATPGK